MSQAPVPGGALEYEATGEGEPVLLIHGGVIAATFLALMDEPALSDYRLIRYHRRGFAGSLEHTGPSSFEQQADDAIAVLDQLGIERAHIVGHSLGGMVALQVAIQAPERVGALVLLEAGPLPPGGDAAGQAPPPGEAPGPDGTVAPGVPMPAPPEPPFFAPYREGNVEGAARAFMRFTGGENWTRDLERAGAGAWQQILEDFHVLIEIELPMADTTPAIDFGRLSAPTLYVIGSETRLGPVTGALIEQSVPSVLPDAETLLLQGMNHSMQMHDPAAIASAAKALLERHPLRDSAR